MASADPDYNHRPKGNGMTGLVAKAERKNIKRQPAKAGVDPSAGGVVKVRKSIHSVESGVRILHALMTAPLGRAPLREIAAAATMSRSQAHRYLLAYINTGVATQEPQSGLYALGPTALKIGLSAVSRLDVVQQSASELRKLVDTVGCTVLLSILGDQGPTVVRWAIGRRPLVTSLNIGSVLPLLTSSAGTVFLAFAEPPRVLELLEYEWTNGYSLSGRELGRKIKAARKDGYASVSGGVLPGLAAISVPVFDREGWPVAVIGLVGSAADKGFLGQRSIDVALEAAHRVSTAIGWEPATGAAIRSDPDADYLPSLTTRSDD
jgi:DNA-binding IclR family transcriptional regulator